MKVMNQGSRAEPLKFKKTKKGRRRSYSLGGRLMVLAITSILGALLGLSLYSTVKVSWAASLGMA
jgi:hypothetical protein